jgi:2,4-dienoyl-CoA reductase-like NADH-dependent reductase (Old Yellow Enzyme family)
MVNDRRLFQPLKLGRSQLENRVAVSAFQRGETFEITSL